MTSEKDRMETGWKQDEAGREENELQGCHSGFSTLFVGTNSTLFVSRTFLPRMIDLIYLLFSSSKTELFCEDLAVLNSRYRSG